MKKKKKTKRKSPSKCVCAVTGRQCVKLEFKYVLIYPSKRAIAFGGVVYNLRKPAYLFSMKFRLAFHRLELDLFSLQKSVHLLQAWTQLAAARWSQFLFSFPSSVGSYLRWILANHPVFWDGQYGITHQPVQSKNVHRFIALLHLSA